MSQEKIEITPFGCAMVGLVALLFLACLFLLSINDYPMVGRDGTYMDQPATYGCAVLATIATLHFPARWVQSKRPTDDGYSNYLAAMLGVGLPVFCCFVALGPLLNGALDQSSPRTYKTVILKKFVDHNSRTGYIWYRLELRDWRDPQETVILGVTESQYASVGVGTWLFMTTKKGWLGYEWLVSPRH